MSYEAIVLGLRWMVGLGLSLGLLLPAACGGGGPLQPASGSFISGSRERAFFLVVAEDGNSVVAYQISCDHAVLLNPQASVPIDDGAFVIENRDVRISGRFTSSVTIEGTIEVRSEYRSCRRPETPYLATCGDPSGFPSIETEGPNVPYAPCKEG